IADLIENWGEMSIDERAYAIGYIIGKYGAEYLMAAGVGKLIAQAKSFIKKSAGKLKGKTPSKKGLRGGHHSHNDPDGGAPNCDGPKCFPAGTQVLMADGASKAIEEIEEGDWVLADDPQDKDGIAARQVMEVIESSTLRLIRVEIDVNGDGLADGEFAATGYHPIWTDN